MSDDRATWLGAAVRTWAALRPDAVALVDGARRWTWAELDAAVDGVASAVGATADGTLGAARRGAAVVALLPTTDACGVAAIHGVARAGVRTVVLHPRWTAVEIASVVARIRPLVVLHASDGALLPSGVPALDLRTLDLGTDGQRRTARVVTGDHDHDQDQDQDQDRIAELVLPTSGTTDPRSPLVRLPLDRIGASVAAWAAVLPPSTGWLLSLGLGHVAGVAIVARAAAAGMPLVIPRSGRSIVDALRAAADAGVAVSHLSLVAAQLAHALETEPAQALPVGVRAVLLGGGPLPAELVVRAIDAGWPVWPSYGSTETASGVAAAAPSDAAARPWSAGRALPGVELRVVDPADPTRDRPSGSPGELLVRGGMVTAAEPRDSLDPDAAADVGGRLLPGGWLRTGDLATLDADGWSRIVDRLDDVIISGGENVAPSEVEAVIAALPGVGDVAVVGAPDATWGARPVAVVVPCRGQDPVDAALLAGAAAVLAPFKRPQRVVRATVLPRGASGKLLRRVLRDPVAAALALPEPVRSRRDVGLEPRIVLADDGQPLAVRVAAARPAGTPTILLLHATLSTSVQLLRLAEALGPGARVVLLDRRGSGGSRMRHAEPVAVGRHAADALAVLDASGVEHAIVVGHSFGGVVALELAALAPDRVGAVLAWEPPWLPLAAEPYRSSLVGVAALVARDHAAGGAAAAARAFMEVVSPGAWVRLRDAQREALMTEGDGVLADVAMPDLDTHRLSTIRVPVTIATGDASEPFYAPIAAGLAERILGARVVTAHGATHHAPITDAVLLAHLVGRLPTTDRPFPERDAQEATR